MAQKILKSDQSSIPAVPSAMPSPQEVPMVQARILVAQKIRREQSKILESLKSMFQSPLTRQFYATSDKIFYVLPRKMGGVSSTIEGLTVHAVKDLANLFGHLDYGVDVLKIYGKESADCVAWCLDLQQNICEKRQFKVYFPDRIKSVKSFSDESYKLIYAEGSRRMRSCIERILPLWLTEAFKAKVRMVQAEEAHGQKQAKRTDFLAEFQSFSNSITQADLDEIVTSQSLPLDTPEARQFLQGCLTSLKSGEARIHQIFTHKDFGTPSEKEQGSKKLDEVREKINK